MKKYIALLMVATSLVSCRTSKVSSDVTAQSEVSNATVTSEAVYLSTLVDSLTASSDVSVDSIVILYQDTDCAETTSGDSGWSDKTDTPNQNPWYPQKKSKPTKKVIYGINMHAQTSHISNAQQMGIEVDSVSRFQHKVDSTARHSATSHPPNSRKRMLWWSLFALAFTSLLLWRAEK